MRARAADPYRDTDVIDSCAPRFDQAIVGVVFVLAVLTAWRLPDPTATRLADRHPRFGSRLTRARSSR